MIISMTGFGSAEATTDIYSLRAEIKTLNSKFFDPVLKVPKEFSNWELDIKSELEKVLKRGKVSLSIEFTSKGDEVVPVRINEPLFNVYYKSFSNLAHEQGASENELFKLALHSPNVIVPRDDFADVISPEELLAVVTASAEKCQEFRIKEGGRLQLALQESIDTIAVQLEMIKTLDPKRIAAIRSRIEKSIGDLKQQIKLDENRFEQELIYYIEKLDISEEKVRLASHLDYFREVMSEDESNGKKLGFISQEIGREINTIGSKANDAEIQRAVVNMKEALEKIKEQVLNVI
ncbi:MAG: YicC/YloC family endoribonuclease [Cyclobacteriaceae bacterium]